MESHWKFVYVVQRAQKNNFWCAEGTRNFTRPDERSLLLCEPFCDITRKQLSLKDWIQFNELWTYDLYFGKRNVTKWSSITPRVTWLAEKGTWCNGEPIKNIERFVAIQSETLGLYGVIYTDLFHLWTSDHPYMHQIMNGYLYQTFFPISIISNQEVVNISPGTGLLLSQNVWAATQHTFKCPHERSNVCCDVSRTSAWK